ARMSLRSCRAKALPLELKRVKLSIFLFSLSVTIGLSGRAGPARQARANRARGSGRRRMVLSLLGSGRTRAGRSRAFVEKEYSGSREGVSDAGPVRFPFMVKKQSAATRWWAGQRFAADCFGRLGGAMSDGRL